MTLPARQKGFTLVEVLVVIAIIGVLASIILSAFSLVRSKGRDAKRAADIRQINSAIQFYINDNGHAPYAGTYNCQPGVFAPDCQFITETVAAEWAQLEADLSPYLSKLPKDPRSSVSYQYVYIPPAAESFVCLGCVGALNSPQSYAIFAYRMENTSQILNFFFDYVATFGFGWHNSYWSGD